MGNDIPKTLEALRVDTSKLKSDLNEMMRPSVEETLNELLDAEADQSAEPATTRTRRTGSIRRPGIIHTNCR